MTLQAAANNQKIPTVLTWDAINHELATDGSPSVDFDRFSQQYDQDPALKSLVQDFNKNRVTLKTNQANPELSHSKQKPSKISKIAKKAVKLGK